VIKDRWRKGTAEKKMRDTVAEKYTGGKKMSASVNRLFLLPCPPRQCDNEALTTI